MIKQSIELLGHKAQDRVTGFTGVISSVSFDLYGCVMAIVTPPIDESGKPREGHWFDIKRLLVSETVMAAPKFEETKMGEERGASERPSSMPFT
jgi:hypothetical protein